MSGGHRRFAWLAVIALLAPACTSHHQAAFAWAGCSFVGLDVSPLPKGQRPKRTADQVRAVVRDQIDKDNKGVQVYPAWVQDPVASTSGISSGATPTVMWVVEEHRVVQPSYGPAPPSNPVGSLERIVMIVDDATLKQGGSFTCGVVAGSHLYPVTTPTTSDACAKAEARSSPAPVVSRLTTRRVLPQGITIDPAPANINPSVSADVALHAVIDTAHASSIEIVFGLYSSPYPANPNPEQQSVPAWVVIAHDLPMSGSFGPCGLGTMIGPVNAYTGERMGETEVEASS